MEYVKRRIKSIIGGSKTPEDPRHAENTLEWLLRFNPQAGSVADEVCRLVTLHEIGGDPRSNLLKDADSISYFEVNMPWYYQREGWEETKRRCIWGYQRLSAKMKKIAQSIHTRTRN